MVFTRSIRRKMVLGLSFVFLMQLAFTLSGISGISSYRRMVKDLDQSIRHAPRRNDLSALLLKLLLPLESDPRKPILPLPVRAKQFFDQLDNVQEQLVEFRQQLQTAAAAANSHVFSDEKELSKLVGEAEATLTYFKSFADDDLSEAEPGENVLTNARWRVTNLIEEIVALPDSAERMHQILDNARADYQYHLRMVCVTGGAGAFLPSGIGWYRKHFSSAKNDLDKSVSIEFDGVMQNSDVWINGFHLGHRPYGYVSFDYELTGHLNFGGGITTRR